MKLHELLMYIEFGSKLIVRDDANDKIIIKTDNFHTPYSLPKEYSNLFLEVTMIGNSQDYIYVLVRKN